MNEEQKAAGRRPAGGGAFAFYLRTGRSALVSVKFNPWHDPDDGRFTFRGQGVHYGRGGGTRVSAHSSTERFIRSGGGGRITIGQAVASPVRREVPGSGVPIAGAVRKPPRGGRGKVPIRPLPKARPAEARQVGIGHNLPKPLDVGQSGGPPLRQNAPLARLFPALAAAPGAATIAAAAVLSNPLGPASSLSRSMDLNESNRLLREIRKIDPQYQLQSLGEPVTPQGRNNQNQQLRWDLAVAAYRVRGDHSHLQAETVRFVQARVDARYEEAVRKYDRGELTTRLSRQEAIGTYIDRHVRSDLRKKYSGLGISSQQSGTVRVNRREYDRSGTDATYRIPDIRIARVAIDMTLTPKSLRTDQVRGFFNGDFLPEAVIIIRPSQLGKGHTYIIPRPKK